MSSRVLRSLKSFGAFWYDFVIGDDWRVAAGVVVGLGLTDIVSGSASRTWWIIVVAVVLMLPMSLWRATRKQ